MRVIRFRPWNFRQEWHQDLRHFLIFYLSGLIIFLLLIG
jgi:hypothetical protein